MNRTLTLLALTATLAAGTTTAAAVSPLSSGHPEEGVPVRAPTGPAGWGALPEAAPADAVALTGGGRLAVAMEDLYGGLQVDATVTGRKRLGDAAWISVWAPGLRWAYGANATVEATSLGVGPMGLGAHVDVLTGRSEHHLAPYLRVMLPTDTQRRHSTLWGVEAGVTASFELHPLVELLPGVGVGGLFVGGADRTITHTTVGLGLDLSFAPWRWLAIGAGVGVRTVPDSPDALEGVDPRVALRFYPWRGLTIDLSAAFPVAGRDRTSGAAWLSLGWVFGPG